MRNYKYLILAFFCISAINCNDIVGAPEDGNTSDEERVKKLFSHSLTQLKDDKNLDLCLIKVSSVKRQVVSGMLYRFETELEHCVDKTLKRCDVELWYRAWDSFKETKLACTDSTKYTVKGAYPGRAKREIKTFGGPTEVDAATLEELKNNITQRFTTLQSENGEKPQLNEIVHATKKVVSGVLYTAETTVDFGKGPEKCQIEVWQKPWLPDFEEIAVKCKDREDLQISKSQNVRQKRSIRPLIEDEPNTDELDVDSDESHFNRFKQSFGRTYKNAREEAMRFRTFQNNLFLIRQLNKFEQGSAVYGVTEFADLTQDEYFHRTGLLPRKNDELDNEIRNPLAEIPDIKLPKGHDWREKNAVTPVKNQGSCGSCWAFSVTGNIEGLNAIKTGELKSFSEQELVDCDDLDAGCNGGLPDNAVKFIEKEGGLELESDYPYTAHRSKSCNFNSTLSRVRVSGEIFSHIFFSYFFSIKIIRKAFT